MVSACVPGAEKTAVSQETLVKQMTDRSIIPWRVLSTTFLVALETGRTRDSFSHAADLSKVTACE